MYVHLEAILNRSRDASASALDECDEACRQHDVVMDGMRQAFIAKWGQVPLLETYHPPAEGRQLRPGTLVCRARARRLRRRLRQT